MTQIMGPGASFLAPEREDDSFVLYQSTSTIEVLVGVGLMVFALGLVAAWFWQPW